MNTVPFFDLQTQVAQLRHEVDAALDGVFRRASFIMGPELQMFEEQFAAFSGVKHCVGVGSGTSALKLSLLALGIGPGDEVIVPANTFIASALAVSHAGATPVFVDIDEFYHLDLGRLQAAITARTRAIMAVHLYGQAMDMQALRELARAQRLFVIEDACQAHGAWSGAGRAGAIGDIGCFSFYPSKNLGAYGDGGAVVTDDDSLAAAVRLARDLGQERKYEHLSKGENSRLDSLQAAILLVKLKYLDEWNDRRRAIAALYDHELRAIGVKPPARRDWKAHVYHLYVVELEDRDQIKDQLQQLGIQTAIHYPTPIHLQPAYADARLPRGAYPRTEEACGRLLSLPMFPEMTPAQAHQVVSALRLAIETPRNGGSKVLSQA